MKTTVEDVMALADDYAGETASDLQFRSGDPDGCRAALRAAVEALAADAERYRLLAPRLLAADFAYGEPPTCAIVFEWPKDARISADLDASIDAARAALKASQP